MRGDLTARAAASTDCKPADVDGVEFGRIAPPDRHQRGEMADRVGSLGGAW